jgi:hypothetical protein
MECNLTTLGISFGKLDRRGFLRGRHRGVDVTVPRDWALGGCGVSVGTQVSLLPELVLLQSSGLGHEWLPGYGICWPASKKSPFKPQDQWGGGRPGAKEGVMFVSVSVEILASPRGKSSSRPRGKLPTESYPRKGGE